MDINYLKMKYFILSKFKERARTHRDDDFDWDIYTLRYKDDHNITQKDFTLVLNPEDYIFKNDELKINKLILPLHPNCSLLYETILQLSPFSVIEIGCGGGDHLHNLNTLKSNITLFGIDISKEQINYLYQRHPDLHANISNTDITLPLRLDIERVDIAYTQAVLMHINTGNNYLHALANMFRYARKQVVLMENWYCHNFLHDIQFLFENKMIEWNNIYFHYRESPELQIPHIMVVSSVPLEYPELEDYSILRRNR
jgi:SAM-dependent methyltransferase